MSTNIDVVQISDKPGLNQVIFLDSIARKKKVTIKVKGGVAINGANGLGKTSYLKTLPIFYGAHPSSLVRVGADKNMDSYCSYYYPNETSYIVYEYERIAIGGGKEFCCVVTWSDKGSEQIKFRFIKAKFDISMVTKIDRTPVAPKELRTHWLNSNFDFLDKVIETYSQYEAIILNNPSLSANIRTKEDGKRFGLFEESDKKIANLWKPLVQMLSSEAVSLKDFKQFACQIALEDQTKIDVMKPKSLNELIQSYSALSQVRTVAPKKEELQKLTREMAQHGNTLKSLIHRIFKAQGLLRLDLEHQEGALSSLESNMTTVEAQFNIEQRRLLDEIVLRESVIQHCTNDIAKRTSAKERYLQSQIEHKIQLVDSQPDLEKKLDDLEALKRDWDDSADKLNKEQAQRISERSLETKDAQAQVNAQLKEAENDVRNAHNHRLAEEQARFDSLLLECEQKQTEKQEQFNEAQVLQRTQENKQYQEDPIVRQQKLALQKEERRLQDEINKVALSMQQELALKSQRERERDQLFNQKNETERQKNRTTDAIDAGREGLNPPKDSLHEFLENTIPDWRDSFGKILSKDVLLSSQTQPHYDQNGIDSRVFGVGLDLTHIPLNASLDLSTLKRRLEDLLAERESLIKSESDLSKKIKEKNEDIKNRTDTIDALQQAEATLKNQKEETISKQEKIESEEAQLRKNFLQSQKELIVLLSEKTQQARTNVEQIKTQIQTLRNDHKTKIQALQSQKTEKLNTLNLQATIELQRIEQGFFDWKQQQEQLFQKKCLEQGVNYEEIRKTQQAIDDLKKELKAIERIRKEVSEYRYFMEFEWIKNEQDQIKIEEATKEKIDFEQTLHEKKAIQSEQQRHFNQTKSTLLATMQQLRKKIENVSDVQERINAVLDPILGLDFNYTVLPENDLVLDADLLMEQVSTHVSGLKEKNRKLDAFWQTHLEVFNRPNTPQFEFLKRMQEDGEGPKDQKEKTITKSHYVLEYFETHLINEETVLKVLANTVYTNSSLFYRELKRFETRVKEFGFGIESELRKMQFHAIDYIKLNMRSKIGNDMPIECLEEFNSVYNDWIRSENPDLVPESLVLAAQRLVVRLKEHQELTSQILVNTIDIDGVVSEKGVEKKFGNNDNVKGISSTGLTYLINASLYIALVQKMKGKAQMRVVWALDELLKLDSVNIKGLLDLLRANDMEMACTFPSGDPEQLSLFGSLYVVREDKGLEEFESLHAQQELTEDELVFTPQEGV